MIRALYRRIIAALFRHLAQEHAASTTKSVLTAPFGLRGVPLESVISIAEGNFNREQLGDLLSAALRPDTDVRAGFGSRDCGHIADFIASREKETQ